MADAAVRDPSGFAAVQFQSALAAIRIGDRRSHAARSLRRGLGLKMCAQQFGGLGVDCDMEELAPHTRACLGETAADRISDQVRAVAADVELPADPCICKAGDDFAQGVVQRATVLIGQRSDGPYEIADWIVQQCSLAFGGYFEA